MYIEGTEIGLREVRREDLSEFLRIRNNYNIAKYFRTVKPLTEWNQEQYWVNVINNPSHIVFTVVEKNTMKLIGEIRASNIDINNLAEIGIVIDNKYRKQGYASEALKLFLEFIFGRTHINRIEAKIAVDNKNSIRFFEKNGFIKEGILREATYYDFKYKDVILMSVLKSGFVNCTNP